MMQVTAVSNTYCAHGGGGRAAGPSDAVKISSNVIEKAAVRKPREAADSMMSTMYSENSYPRGGRADMHNANQLLGTQDSVGGIRGCSIYPGREQSIKAASGTNSSLDTKQGEASMSLRNATSSMCSTLRREQAVMYPDLYLQLCLERQRRRHDPTHGMDTKGEDYIYYNHRSKGCYIPRKPLKDTLTLTYNHMFDFTDGSRFMRGSEEPPRPNPSVVDMHTGTFKSLKRASRKELALTASMNAGYPSLPHYSLTLSSPRRQIAAQLRRTVSVDLARSLQVSDLRGKPFEKRVSIEYVIADDMRKVAKVEEGVGSVVAKGKIKLEEIPEKLRQALSEEQVREGAIHDSQKASMPPKGGYSMEEVGSKRYVTNVICDPARLWNNEEGEDDDDDKKLFASSEEGPRHQHVVFTDHADRVLLGLMGNVRQPVIHKDGEPSHDYTGLRGDEGEGEKKKERHERGGGDEARISPACTEELSQVDGSTRTVSQPPPADGARPGLLPPIAVAAMRDAEWFAPTPSARSKNESNEPTSSAQWAPRLPEKPLPFEASRLAYCRNFDVGSAHPPEGKVHWSTMKKLL